MSEAASNNGSFLSAFTGIFFRKRTLWLVINNQLNQSLNLILALTFQNRSRIHVFFYLAYMNSFTTNFHRSQRPTFHTLLQLVTSAMHPTSYLNKHFGISSSQETIFELIDHVQKDNIQHNHFPSKEWLTTRCRYVMVQEVTRKLRLTCRETKGLS